MINFSEELKNFEPVKEIEELQNIVGKDDIQDIFELMQLMKNPKDKE